MDRPTLAAELSPFEVFSSRDMTAGAPIVARLIGRHFDKMLSGGGYHQPYDADFSKTMVKTLVHLCQCLGASFGISERCEMSMYAIAQPVDGRRLLSRIAGEASAKMSLLSGKVLTFEARLYEFPVAELALRYFRWRQEELLLTAVDRHFAHLMQQGHSTLAHLTEMSGGLGQDEKLELLRQHGVEIEKIPTWQQCGVCVRLERPHERATAEPAETGVRLMVEASPPQGAAFDPYLRSHLGL